MTAWRGGGRDLPEMLLGLGVLLLVAITVLLVRLAVAALLVAVARALPGRRRLSAGRAAVRCSPRLLRPLVVAALGTTVAVCAAGPAGATTRAPSRGAAVNATPAPQLPAAGWADAPPGDDQAPLPDAGWVASRPARPPVAPHLVSSTPTRAGVAAATRAADRGPRLDPGLSEASDVVVRRGDTLWSLAARQLGAGATDAEVAAWWPRWWQANRALIGPDPDRLQPGTRLLVPRAGSR